MMKYIAMVLVLASVLSCKSDNKKVESVKEELGAKKEVNVSMPDYPEALMKIFENHGGINNWKSKKSLVFHIGEEQHTIDLQSRMDRIDGPGYSLGFDGDKVWLQDVDKAYKGDPVFYHNLRFYFFAMPFLLGDKGIIYGETEDLEYEGVSYPGIAISFKSGTGVSYKDEYFLHYDPKTYEMAWLGYTVSYRSGERSNKVNWIRYHDWKETNGLKLPVALTWYSAEGRTIKAPRKPVVYEKVAISEQASSPSLFKKPQNAVFVEGKVQE